VNSSINRYPPMAFYLFDYAAGFNITEVHRACGNPPYFYVISTPVTRVTTMTLRSNIFEWHDDLHTTPSIPGCAEQRAKYRYYSAAIESSYTDLPLAGGPCDVAVIAEGYVFCRYSLYVLQGSVLTTYKSAHGTTPLNILTDEGGILGGILFLTWFMGLFNDAG
jgi:hypothetical protein